MAKRCAVSTQTPRFNSGHASMIVFNSVKFRANRTPVPRGIFKKNLQIARFRAARGLLQSQCDGGNRALDAPAHAAPRMQHQVIGSQRGGPHNFLVKRLYRPRSQHAIRRSQINQIIAVNDQRPPRQFLAPRPEIACRVCFRVMRTVPRSHIRGLDENICSVLAPNPCAISSAPATSPAMDV